MITSAGILPNSVPDSDIVIVGGGIAGSLLALVLGRAGHRVSLIDPQQNPKPDFRNEKLGIDQIERLADLGVLPCFEEAAFGDELNATWALKDCGARYDRWVSCLRRAFPSQVSFIRGKVDAIDTSDDLQAVTLSDGRRITGRLVALTTGRGERLRASLGVRRRVFSEGHSLCLGFSVAHKDGTGETQQAQVFNGRFGDRIGYVTAFPMLGELRVNVFSYRDLDDPWVAQMRADPVRTLVATLPAMAGMLAGRQVVRPLEMRSTDLYEVEGHERAGVVLLGDAFHSPCPSSGTGVTRILNDVERLAHTHLPAWLATPGMDGAKIAAFYADPVKQKVDGVSLHRSLSGRAAATDTSLRGRFRRPLSKLKRGLLLSILDPAAAAAA